MRLQTTIRDSDFEKIKKAAEESGDDANDIVRKALGMYLWARQKKRDGLAIGAVDPTSRTIVTTIDLDE
jgi:hypothetical protein